MGCHLELRLTCHANRLSSILSFVSVLIIEVCCKKKYRSHTLTKAIREPSHSQFASTSHILLFWADPQERRLKLDTSNLVNVDNTERASSLSTEAKHFWDTGVHKCQVTSAYELTCSVVGLPSSCESSTCFALPLAFICCCFKFIPSTHRKVRRERMFWYQLGLLSRWRLSAKHP